MPLSRIPGLLAGLLTIIVFSKTEHPVAALVTLGVIAALSLAGHALRAHAAELRARQEEEA